MVVLAVFLLGLGFALLTLRRRYARGALRRVSAELVAMKVHDERAAMAHFLESID
jgi:hypothetical protein